MAGQTRKEILSNRAKETFEYCRGVSMDVVNQKFERKRIRDTRKTTSNGYRALSGYARNTCSSKEKSGCEKEYRHVLSKGK